MAEILPEDSGTIRCICGFDHDDNFTIQCERCNAWQHAKCVNISDENSVPEHYLCPECSGNTTKVDAAQAREHQKQFKKRKEEYERYLENAVASPDGSHAQKPPRLRSRGSRRSLNSDHDSRGSSKSGGQASAIGAQAQHAGLHADGNTTALNDSALPPPEDFNPNFFNISIETNRWSDKAQKLWDDIKEKEEIVHELPLKLAQREYTENQKSVKVERNAKSQNTWNLGIEAAGLICNASFGPNALVTEVIGEVKTRMEYASNPLNRYAQLECPEYGVFFVPGQPFVIDTRNYGSPALFIKRSAMPNAYLSTREDKKGRLRVFISTRKSVRPGTELTLGWFWSADHPIQKCQAALADESISEPDSQVKEMLWLLGEKSIENVSKSRKAPPGADEEWGKVNFALVPERPPPAQLRRDRIAMLDVGQEISEDPMVAPEENVWQPASESAAPPSKKRLSLADYRKKRT